MARHSADKQAGRRLLWDGGEVSRAAAATLRSAHFNATYLEGGIAGWRNSRLPTRRKFHTQTRKWVTRERPKIDRIACPWLIRRFIDPDAEFLYVPTERVLDVARGNRRHALRYRWRRIRP